MKSLNTFTDQLGRSICLSSPAKRIVSLVPSQTELLYDLGLEEETLGITRFCIHPRSWFRTKTRVGGTKDLHLDLIRALQPDLILANREENRRQQVEALMEEFPVWVSDVSNLGGARDLIVQVAALTGRESRGARILRDLDQAWAELEGWLEPRLLPGSRPLTAYLIWKNPWMAAGRDTFISAIMERAGFLNYFSGRVRYPVIDLEQMESGDPELLLLSSEPYPFREAQRAELSLRFPRSRVLLVDGTLFSWYGSRLIQTPGYLKKIWQQWEGSGNPARGQHVKGYDPKD